MIIESTSKTRTMKSVILIFSLLLSVFSFSQNDIMNMGGNKEVPCYEKTKAAQKNGVNVWGCGNELGVVDCNEELEVHDGTGLIIKRAVDNVNLAGVGKPYTGKCESCHMNGIVARRITFVDGKENGIDTAFYESGCIQAIRSHIQGTESGSWYFYFDSTQQVAWEMNYYLGEKHGKHVYMKANGDTTKEETYKNGLLHGVKKSFYKDSKIFKEVTYANGVMDGSFKTYNIQGVIIEDLMYKAGKKHEVCKYFYDDGVLLKTENWNNGVKEGEFKMFYYQGHVQTLETYKKGMKEGKFEEYYPDQKLKQQAFYMKDVLVEEHRFDELGNETYTFGGSTNSGAEDDEIKPGKKPKGK